MQATSKLTATFYTVATPNYSSMVPAYRHLTSVAAKKWASDGHWLNDSNFAHYAATCSEFANGEAIPAKLDIMQVTLSTTDIATLAAFVDGQSWNADLATINRKIVGSVDVSHLANVAFSKCQVAA